MGRRRTGRLGRAAVGGAMVAALLLAGGPSPAAADPDAGANRAAFPLTCGDRTYLVVGGAGAPAHVVDDRGVLIAATIVLRISHVDPATDEVVTRIETFALGQGRRAGQQDDLVVCSYRTTLEDPAVGPVTVEGTVTVFETPRAA